MKALKPMRLGLLQRVVQHDRRSTLAVAVLVYVPFDNPRRLINEQLLWKDLGAVVPGGLIDEGNPKARGEVLVAGRAFALGGTPAPAVAVRLRMERDDKALVDKKLVVIGDRYWSGSSATAPGPFVSMPLDYAHAYGGDGYALNPTGKGFALIESEHGPVRPLPNVEDPDKLILSPSDKRQPAGYAAIDSSWPQRFELMGKRYDDKWLKTRFPGPAEDFDAHFYNTAPRDQQIDGFFRGDERFVLDGMHPDKPRITGRLEPLVARVFVTQRTAAGETFRAFGTRLDTVYLFPHLERAVLVHRATIDVAEDDADDIVHLMVAAEAPDQPKPIEHYQGVLALRLDKEKGALASLRDADLLPPKEAGWSSTIDVGELGEMVKPEHRGLDNQQRGVRRKLAEAEAKMIAAGYDVGDAFRPPDVPAPPDPYDIDALLELADAQRVRSAKLKEEMDAKSAAMQERARKSFADAGYDWDAELKRGQDKVGGPPTFSADGHLGMLHDMARIAQEGGRPIAKLEQDLTEPAYEQGLRVLEAQVKESYRRFAHSLPAAGKVAEDARQHLRVLAVAAKDGGESLARRNFTGADLHDLDLRGMDLCEIFLEGADLSGANLSGANLSKAVLTRAKLDGADLSGADLTGANLGATKLLGTNLSDAILDETVLARAELAGTRLNGARLRETSFFETVFTEADFSHVDAELPLFLRSDLRKVHFIGARMKQVRIVESDVRGVDFTGADLRGAMFVKTIGDGASFTGANLEGAVVVHESSFLQCGFSDALMTKFNALRTPLTGGNFERAVLTEANFAYCDLRGAKLQAVVARQALLIRTNLEGADLRRADLLGAILQKANLIGANLTGANLSRADVSLARMDVTTRLDEALMLDARLEPKYQPPKEPRV